MKLSLSVIETLCTLEERHQQRKREGKSEISSATMETSGEINEVTSFQGLAIFLAAGRQELLSAASLSA